MSAGVLFDAPGPKARRRHMILTGVGVLLLAAVLWVVYKRLDDKGQFTAAMWKPFTDPELWKEYILPGLVGTLKAAFAGMIGATIFGVIFAMARMSQIKPLSWAAGVIVEFGRAIPVLLMMLFLYGALTRGGAEDIHAFIATVTALVIYNGSVVAEVIRSGVDQLPKGQREAGVAIGLTDSQTLRSILLPQAVTAMLPTLISQLVVILKDTALGYQVQYGEMLYKGKNASTIFANIVPTLIVIGTIYILLNYAISKVAVLAEKWLQNRGRAAEGSAQGGGPAGGVTAGVATVGAPGVDLAAHNKTL
ncbi:ABC transporter permease subunit [Dermacoccus abyssi]|uniref:ABC transporter permease subunit n=1 Tax=Dermacoccus abyssi TaxID=322596 RepID=A0ABX5Z9V3_9MICO|nr:ABC transporter permease subunit [Dermacoccus abyssi]